MNTPAGGTAGSERVRQKFQRRREELAGAATSVLVANGYARTSMRDIASGCGVSLGTLHYYFEDKNDIIACCVRLYKAGFIAHYLTLVREATSAGEFRRHVCTSIDDVISDDAQTHRFWYDLRNVGLFEERFREQIREIDDGLSRLAWRVATKYADLAHARVVSTPAAVYAAVDGLFHAALLRRIRGDAAAGAELAAEVDALFDVFVRP